MSAHTLGPAVSSVDGEFESQIQRILRSEVFRGSETLRKYFEYLGVRAFESGSEPVKAKDIAAAVFGRSSDFDPQNDSIVRVHAGRLRARLAEYYSSEGSEDELIITIPKGSYALSVINRRTAGPPAQPQAFESAAVSEPRPVRRKYAPALRNITIKAAILLVTIALTWMAARSRMLVSSAGSLTPALKTLWAPFLASEEAPVIVYSNCRVIDLLSNDTGLYPTNGEVLGVFHITRLLASVQKPVRAKHGALLTWDEARDSDLIFVGGPLATRTPLREAPTFHDFEFRMQNRTDGQPGQVGTIVNRRPKAGEQAVYYGSRAKPSLFDYAVVALSPAFTPKRRALVLAGICEYGTQGAADFVTREDRVRDLLAKLHVREGDPAPLFEAVLRFNIQGDVPLQPEIVALHDLR